MGTGPGASVDTGRSFRVHYGTDVGLVSMAVRPGACGQVVRQLGRPLLHETGKLLVEQPGDRHAMESWRTMRDMGLRADRLGRGRVAEEWPGFEAEQATVDRLGGVLDPEVILQGLAAWLGNEGVEWRREALYDEAIFLQEHAGRDTSRYGAALDLYDRILVLDSANASAAFNKGFVYLEYLADYGNAERWFDEAIARLPRYHQAHYNRGLAIESQGRSAEALEAYDAALAIDPAYTPAAIAKGRVLGR